VNIYISGAIHGKGDGGKRRFEQAANLVEKLGHEAVNPHDIPAHEHKGDCPPAYSSGNGHSAACWMRTDLAAMLLCDAVLMIGQWQHSVGAQREHSVACWTGIPIYYRASEIPDARELAKFEALPYTGGL